MQVSGLVKGRPGILAYVVRRPDACRSFFEWVRTIGCDSPGVVKIICRFPPILKVLQLQPSGGGTAASMRPGPW